MKLRAGELLALAGVVCLVFSLLRPWYETPGGNIDLWDTFGAAAVLMLLTLAAGAAMVLAAVTERDSPALAVASAVWCVVISAIGVVAAAIRLLERPDGATGLCAGAWLGFAGTVLTLLGAWLTLRDEHTSRYQPARPQPRPRP